MNKELIRKSLETVDPEIYCVEAVTDLFPVLCIIIISIGVLSYIIGHSVGAKTKKNSYCVDKILRRNLKQWRNK